VDLRTLGEICTATKGRLTTVQSINQLEKSLVAAGEAIQEPTNLLSVLTPRKPFVAMTIQVAGLPEIAIISKQEPSTPSTPVVRRGRRAAFERSLLLPSGNADRQTSRESRLLAVSKYSLPGDRS
jgi:hypothetical protein